MNCVPLKDNVKAENWKNTSHALVQRMKVKRKNNMVRELQGVQQGKPRCGRFNQHGVHNLHSLYCTYQLSFTII